jgi:hypothetical protein
LKVYNVSLTDDLQETTVEDGDDVFWYIFYSKKINV